MQSGATIAAPDGFVRRRVGRTALWISEIGFGTGSLGGLFAAAPDEQGRATIREALSLGIGYVDTSPFYGYGRSEHLLGEVLRETDRDIVLSTKVGRLLDPYWGSESEREGWVNPLPFAPRYDYSYDGIMRSVADSRQRLGRSQIDMLFVHDIGTMNHGPEQNAIFWRQLAEGGYRALGELKASGQVKAIGLGVNEWQVLVDAFDLGEWDAFLLAQRYTLLEQHSLSLMDACVRRGTSIIVGGVFNGGLLVGGGRWNYRPAPDDVRTHLEALAQFCADRGVALAAAAVQMPLAHPAVCCVLAGGTTPEEVRQFAEWSRTEIPHTYWHDLAASGLLRAGTPLPGGLTAS